MVDDSGAPVPWWRRPLMLSLAGLVLILGVAALAFGRTEDDALIDDSVEESLPETDPRPGEATRTEEPDTATLGDRPEEACQEVPAPVIDAIAGSLTQAGATIGEARAVRAADRDGVHLIAGRVDGADQALGVWAATAELGEDLDGLLAVDEAARVLSGLPDATDVDPELDPAGADVERARACLEPS